MGNSSSKKTVQKKEEKVKTTVSLIDDIKRTKEKARNADAEWIKEQEEVDKWYFSPEDRQGHCDNKDKKPKVFDVYEDGFILFTS